MSRSLAPALDRSRIRALGTELREALVQVAERLVPRSAGSGALAAAAGMGPAFGSRLHKALRQDDPIAVLFHLPGPGPMQRFVDAAASCGGDAEACARAARAVARLDRCIREEAGSRSGLHAALSAWLPEQAADFVLARRQELFRAWSQLKGAAVECNLAAVMLHPGARAGRLDVTWVMGLLGLRRLRAGATVKLASRRMSAAGAEARAPDPSDLGAYCHAPVARLEARRAGDTVHYLLGDSGAGLSAAVDLLLAERNRDELPYGRSATDPERRSHVFAEVGTPARVLQFDFAVHRSLFPGQTPALHAYDTVLDGVADVNDPARDVDRLELAEGVEEATSGLAELRLAELPGYADLLQGECRRAGWNPDDYRVWRCRVETPPYGCQVVLSFAAPVVR